MLNHILWMIFFFFFNFSLVELATFEKLEILDFSQNNFIGSIPPCIGALSNLKALSLAENKLNGSLPTQGKNKFRTCCMNF